MNFKVEKFILDLRKLKLLFKNKNNFIEKYLSEIEKDQLKFINPEKELNYYAKIYSGKKSLKNILNLENINYKDIYIEKEKNGKPYLNFTDKNLFFNNYNIKDNFDIFLSFSHEDNFLVAFLLKELKNK